MRLFTLLCGGGEIANTVFCTAKTSKQAMPCEGIALLFRFYFCAVIFSAAKLCIRYLRITSGGAESK